MGEFNKENRLEMALNLRGMKQIELSEKTGIRKSSINGWVNQRWQPKQDSLYKMAKVLDVSEMWLAGYDVPMERPSTTDAVNRCMAYLNRLAPDQLLYVEKMLKDLAED